MITPISPMRKHKLLAIPCLLPSFSPMMSWGEVLQIIMTSRHPSTASTWRTFIFMPTLQFSEYFLGDLFFLMLLIKCSYFNALPYALYYGVMVELLLKTHCSTQALNCTARSFVSPSWTVFGLAHVPVPNSSTFDLTKSVLCRREKVEKNVAGMSGWNLLILELIFISMDFVWAVA